MLNWYLFSRSETEKLLGTDFEKGLSSSAALLRSTENDAVAREVREFFFPFTTFLRSVGGMLSDFSVLMLLISALLCKVFAGSSGNIAVIIGFILVCSLIRTILIIYSGNALHDSRSEDTFRVLRDGKLKSIKGTGLVRGDVIHLSKGDIAPCDLRLIDSENLSVIEKYGGRRVKPVSKDAMYFPLQMREVPLRMRKNMVYAGSAVTSGDALAVVIDERMTLSEARKIILINDDIADCYISRQKQMSGYGTRLLRRSSFGTSAIRDGGYSEETSVNATAERVAAIMRLCGLGAGTLIFILGLFSKSLLSDTFMFSVAVMACAPSVLYELCIACAFAVGAVRLKTQGAHIRNFECAEKLVLSKNLLCCGSTCFNVDKMVAESCYTGRRLDITRDNLKHFRGLCEMLLCTSELYYRTDKNGIRSIGGDLEGLAILEASQRTGVINPGDERRYIERITEFHDINGSLTSTFCSYHGTTVLITKGSTASILKKCKYYDVSGSAEILDVQMRDRILENAKAFENNESCRVVAVGFKPCERVGRNDFRDGFIFMGFVVFGTRLNYDSEKYVSLLRRNGITPVIFSNEVSNMVINDAKKIGVLREDDNYITSKSMSSLDEKIYSDDLTSYTLYMGLGGLQKRAVVNNRKYSDKLVVVAADKPADAFDMSECDVLMSFGKDAPKTLRRISDIHSESRGIGVIYRTICICRNMIRCSALSAGYLVCAQVAAIVFGLFGIVASLFNGGNLPIATPQLLSSVFITDLVISLMTAFIKTPGSIISDSPASFVSYYTSGRIIPKAVFSGFLCGFCSFLGYLFTYIQTLDIAPSASCAFFVMFFSKCLVSLFCIMRTSTGKAPAPFTVVAAAGELICALVMVIAFGKTLIPVGFGAPVIETALVMSIIPVVLSYFMIAVLDRN